MDYTFDDFSQKGLIIGYTVQIQIGYCKVWKQLKLHYLTFICVCVFMFFSPHCKICVHSIEKAL